jgi:hypothetical protein
MGSMVMAKETERLTGGELVGFETPNPLIGRVSG